MIKTFSKLPMRPFLFVCISYFLLPDTTKTILNHYQHSTPVDAGATTTGKLKTCNISLKREMIKKMIKKKNRT